MNPAGRVVMVTGAAGCLGAAVVKKMAILGARVVAVDRDAQRLTELGDGIGKKTVDLLDEPAVVALVADVWASIGPIEVLVNAAGLIHSAPLINPMAKIDRRLSLADFRTVMDANLTSTFVATAAVADLMAAKRVKGVVVNLSSIAGQGNAGQSAYSAAKAGIEALTAVWAKELGPLGIRVTALAPGFIDTPSTRSALSEAAQNKRIDQVPLRRMGTTEEVVDAIHFLIANDYLSGTTLRLDGGLRL